MSAPTPPLALVNAVKRMLKPLIRLLLEYGITFPYLSNLLKTLFVEVVNEEMQVDGKRQTQSRISVVSGVHRKDVKRILETADDPVQPGRTVSMGARIMGIWLGDARYQNNAGQPLPLPRTADNNATPSFEMLVESVNKDVRPRAILDEWLRAGLVTVNTEDQVVIDPDAFVTEKNFDDRAHFFGRNMRDHMATGVHNLMPGVENKLFERAVFYDHLTEESVAQLQSMSHKLAMDALQAINEEALRLADKDTKSAHAHFRMTFGSYYFQQQEHNTRDQDGADETR